MGLIQNETTATKPPKPPSPLRGMAGDRLGTGWGRAGQAGAPSRTWIDTSPAVGPSEAGDADPQGSWGTRDMHRPAQGRSWPWPQIHCRSAQQVSPQSGFWTHVSQISPLPSIARIRASRGSMRGPPCPLLPGGRPHPDANELKWLRQLPEWGRPLRPPQDAIQ